MLYLYFITPNLGLLRNYVKYKKFNLSVYLRSYIVYFYFHLMLLMLGFKNIILTTLIIERWFWFIYKTFKSFIKNDYIRKQNKYKIKYNLKYQDNSSVSVKSIVSSILTE